MERYTSFSFQRVLVIGGNRLQDRIAELPDLKTPRDLVCDPEILEFCNPVSVPLTGDELQKKQTPQQ